MHLKDIFKSRELSKDSVCKESLHTGKDGKQYLTKFMNLGFSCPPSALGI